MDILFIFISYWLENIFEEIEYMNNMMIVFVKIYAY